MSHLNFVDARKSIAKHKMMIIVTTTRYNNSETDFSRLYRLLSSLGTACADFSDVIPCLVGHVMIVSEWLLLIYIFFDLGIKVLLMIIFDGIAKWEWCVAWRTK